MFLVSSTLEKSGRWDFPKLQLALTNDLEAIQKEAFVLSLVANCKEIVAIKYYSLDERRSQVALQAALCVKPPSIMPKKRVPIHLKESVLVEEVRFYMNQMGLTKEALSMMAEECEVPLEDLLSLLSSDSHCPPIEQGDIEHFIKWLVPDENAVEVHESMWKRFQTFLKWMTKHVNVYAYEIAYESLGKILKAVRESTLRVLNKLAEVNKERAETAYQQ